MREHTYKRREGEKERHDELKKEKGYRKRKGTEMTMTGRERKGKKREDGEMTMRGRTRREEYRRNKSEEDDEQ